MPDARRGCHGNAQTRSERSAEGRGSEALSRELSLGFRWARAVGADGAGLPAAAGPCRLLVAPASSAAAALRLGSIPRTDHFCRLHCHQPGPGHHLELRSPSSALGRGLPASS